MASQGSPGRHATQRRAVFHLSFATLVSFVSLVVAIQAGPQAPPTPPTPPPAQSGATFRAATRLIVQTVSVKDKDGRPIEGLTSKDFTVTEDGEPQMVSFVEFQRLPTT